MTVNFNFICAILVYIFLTKQLFGKHIFYLLTEVFCLFYNIFFFNSAYTVSGKSACLIIVCQRRKRNAPIDWE